MTIRRVTMTHLSTLGFVPLSGSALVTSFQESLQLIEELPADQVTEETIRDLELIEARLKVAQLEEERRLAEEAIAESHRQELDSKADAAIARVEAKLLARRRKEAPKAWELQRRLETCLGNGATSAALVAIRALQHPDLNDEVIHLFGGWKAWQAFLAEARKKFQAL